MLFGSAVPISVGEAFMVMPSVSDRPVSEPCGGGA